MYQNWYLATKGSLEWLWNGAKYYFWRGIGALIIIIIGWFVAVICGRIVAEILRKLKFNAPFEEGKWKEVIEKSEWKVDPSGFVGAVVKWTIFIAFLLASVETLGFVQLAGFVSRIANWLPNVIVAAAIFIVAVILAEYVTKIIVAISRGFGIKYTNILGEIVRWAIWTFAGLAILYQLGVAREFIITLFQGFVAFLVIAGGLSFGLGGKDAAARLIEDIRQRLKE